MDVRFVWHVPDSGHEWKHREGKLRLVWKEERKGGWTGRYIPKVGSFREFAALATTKSRQQAEIQTFANKYGDIIALPGSSFDVFAREDGITWESDQPGTYYRKTIRSHALLSTWRQAIQQMRRAVDFWDFINKKETLSGARLEVLAELRARIESALKDTTTPSFTRVCLNQKMELFAHPVNLLAFMWLTLARLVSGEIVEQPCVGKSRCCLGYVYTGLGNGLKKTGTLTCSIACRKWKERHTSPKH